MANYKETHYLAQLPAALTAGQWSAPYPAKAPNAAALSWPELLRKYNKHCRGARDVAEVASQTRVLALLLSSNAQTDDDFDGGNGDGSILDLGTCCRVPEEHAEEAASAYASLKQIEASNSDVRGSSLSSAPG